MILDIGGNFMIGRLLARRFVNRLPGLGYFLKRVKSTANTGDHYRAGLLYAVEVIYCAGCKSAQCAKRILCWQHSPRGMQL